MGDDAATLRRRRRQWGPAPVLVRPEGRTDSRAIGPGGPITVKPKGLTDLTARRYGPPEGGILRVRLYSVSNLPANKRVRQIEHRVRPVADSHRHPTYLPTSGHVKQRQRQRRRQHDSHCGVMCCQVWRKNLRRPACWSRRMQSQRLGLILSGFVWPDPVCGLSDTWPVQLLAD